MAVWGGQRSRVLDVKQQVRGFEDVAMPEMQSEINALSVARCHQQRVGLVAPEKHSFSAASKASPRG